MTYSNIDDYSTDQILEELNCRVDTLLHSEKKLQKSEAQVEELESYVRILKTQLDELQKRLPPSF